MAFSEINLRVIYVLLQSDWFAQNLEFESLNPGRSAQTNFSFPLPATFRTRMHILGKTRLARETRVRACLCERPYLWACVRVFNCMCVLSCVFVRMLSCMNVFLWVCIRVSMCVPE